MVCLLLPLVKYSLLPSSSSCNNVIKLEKTSQTNQTVQENQNEFSQQHEHGPFSIPMNGKIGSIGITNIKFI